MLLDIFKTRKSITVRFSNGFYGHIRFQNVQRAKLYMWVIKGPFGQKLDIFGFAFKPTIFIADL